MSQHTAKAPALHKTRMRHVKALAGRQRSQLPCKVRTNAQPVQSDSTLHQRLLIMVMFRSATTVAAAEHLALSRPTIVQMPDRTAEQETQVRPQLCTSLAPARDPSKLCSHQQQASSTRAAHAHCMVEQLAAFRSSRRPPARQQNTVAAPQRKATCSRRQPKCRVTLSNYATAKPDTQAATGAVEQPPQRLHADQQSIIGVSKSLGALPARADAQRPRLQHAPEPLSPGELYQW
jgi:hypothetical protein